QSLSVGMSSWQSQDFGFTYRTVRVLVGNASSRSHEAQRTESGVTLAANTTYSSQFSGWFSTGVRIASMNAQVLDYRSPALSVTNGALATTDTEPVAGTLTGGFNPSTGAYVVGSTATGATLQLQFPSGVTTRYRPALTITDSVALTVTDSVAAARPTPNAGITSDHRRPEHHRGQRWNHVRRHLRPHARGWHLTRIRPRHGSAPHRQPRSCPRLHGVQHIRQQRKLGGHRSGRRERLRSEPRRIRICRDPRGRLLHSRGRQRRAGAAARNLDHHLSGRSCLHQTAPRHRGRRRGAIQLRGQGDRC